MNENPTKSKTDNITGVVGGGNLGDGLHLFAADWQETKKHFVYTHTPKTHSYIRKKISKKIEMKLGL